MTEEQPTCRCDKLVDDGPGLVEVDTYFDEEGRDDIIKTSLFALQEVLKDLLVFVFCWLLSRELEVKEGKVRREGE